MLVAVVALVGACGEDGDDSSASTSTSATDTTASETSTTAVDPCVPQGSADPVSGPSQSDFALLEGVRSAGHPCVDRVTFEFRGTGQPGYQIGYEPGPAVQDGSGEPVAVEGSAFLVVRLSPASGFDSGTSTPSYEGPPRVEPNGANFVTEIVRTGDFEGTLTWVVGLDQQRPFSVFRLQDTSRIYIDIG
jgi:hypothetical protein